MGRKRKKGLDIDGWLVIDKPAGVGSTPIVSKVKYGLNANKAGHAGTLDPFATGILPIALGMATKTIPFVQDADKQYLMTLQFGTSTDTLDPDGTVVASCENRPTVRHILDVIPHFVGAVQQTPPAYSAIKINGKRAYDVARSGEEVQIPPRTVRIDHIRLISITDINEQVFQADSWDDFLTVVCESVVMQVQCGKGTYIRSLGRDLAVACHTVGYVTALRRTKVGIFSQKNALSLAHFEKIVHNTPCTDNTLLSDMLLSIESALVGIPVVTVTGRDATRFCAGVRVPCPASVDIPHNIPLVIATAHSIYGLATTDGKVITATRVFYKPVPRRKI